MARVLGQSRLIYPAEELHPWEAESETFLQSLETGLAENPVDLTLQLDLLTHAWQAKCLAVATSRDNFKPKLFETLGRIREQKTCPVILRWINEVETETGSKPKRPYHVIIDDPNVLKRGKPE